MNRSEHYTRQHQREKLRQDQDWKHEVGAYTPRNPKDRALDDLRCRTKHTRYRGKKRPHLGPERVALVKILRNTARSLNETT